MKYLFLLFFLITKANAQNNRVLHYTETSGFDHATRTVSFDFFFQLGIQHGFLVDDDSTGVSFNSLVNLQQYDVVVFSNTTGDNILDSLQKLNFENYINAGGNFLGIHSASDTYRHSSANGANTGSWDWYAEMLGASVQQNPNHVSGTPVYRMDVINPHPSVANVPNPWFKAEEYYYWESGYSNPANVILQMVEQTIGPNGLVNSYDSARAVTWYKVLPGGGKSFYTSLGHSQSNFYADTLFRNLIRDALLWIMNLNTSIQFPENNHDSFLKFPNIVRQNSSIQIKGTPCEQIHIKICSSDGKEIYEKQGRSKITIDINSATFRKGLYLISGSYNNEIVSRKMVVVE